MLMIGSLLRPWAVEVRNLGCTPKLLADDILLIVQGNLTYSKFCPAFDFTLKFLDAEVGMISGPKSFLFASSATLRKELSRYLGAQITTRKRPLANILSDRLAKATAMIRK